MEGEESGRFDEPCHHCCYRVQCHCRPRYYVIIVTIPTSQPLPICPVSFVFTIAIAIKVKGVNWVDSDVGGHGFSEAGALALGGAGTMECEGPEEKEFLGLRIVGLRPQNYLQDNN